MKAHSQYCPTALTHPKVVWSSFVHRCFYPFFVALAHLQIVSPPRPSIRKPEWAEELWANYDFRLHLEGFYIPQQYKKAAGLRVAVPLFHSEILSSLPLWIYAACRLRVSLRSVLLSAWSRQLPNSVFSAPAFFLLLFSWPFYWKISTFRVVHSLFSPHIWCFSTNYVSATAIITLPIVHILQSSCSNNHQAASKLDRDKFIVSIPNFSCFTLYKTVFCDVTIS